MRRHWLRAGLVPVKALGLSNLVDLSVGEVHTCATSATGQTFCWGFGGNGELGDGRPWWPTPQLVNWTAAATP